MGLGVLLVGGVWGGDRMLRLLRLRAGGLGECRRGGRGGGGAADTAAVLAARRGLRLGFGGGPAMECRPGW